MADENPASCFSTRFNVVYHVTTINHWQLVLSEQLPILLGNRNLKSLTVTIAATSDAALGAVQDMIADAVNTSSYSISLSMQPSPMFQFEHTAMTLVDRMAWQDGSPVLYFHMKGVSFFPPNPLWEKWRRYLNQFIAQANQWADFLVASDYDACGPLQLFDPQHGFTYFAGNFWMVKSDYLRRLPLYSDFIKHPGSPCFAPLERALAELAVNRTKQMKPFATDGTALTWQSVWPYLVNVRI